MDGEFLGPVFVVATIAFVFWKFFDARHKERMAMIEKGVNPAEFKSSSLTDWIRTSPLSSLKWGMLAAFIGVGLFAASVLERKVDFPDAIYPASMLFSGGLALVIYYFIAAAKLNKNKD